MEKVLNGPFILIERGRESGMGVTEEELWKVLEQKA